MKIEHFLIYLSVLVALVIIAGASALQYNKLLKVCQVQQPVVKQVVLPTPTATPSATLRITIVPLRKVVK